MSGSRLTVKSADFRYGCNALAQLPAPDLPEVAIIGRSNAGKSTLINRLTNRRHLARTSSTPGRTQQLNYFEIQLLHEERELRIFLVDLPGFGYAAVSHAKRAQLHKLIQAYLTRRQTVEVVCLLNDCRRLPEQDELELRQLVFESGKHLLVVLTKSDKLSRNELKKQRAAIAAAYGLEPDDLLLSGEKVPAGPIWERVLSIMEE